jgi:hypothetical protein
MMMMAILINFINIQYNIWGGLEGILIATKTTEIDQYFYFLFLNYSHNGVVFIIHSF